MKLFPKRQPQRLTPEQIRTIRKQAHSIALEIGVLQRNFRGETSLDFVLWTVECEKDPEIRELLRGLT